jgi:peptide/nickel transport system substrate-binding protein
MKKKGLALLLAAVLALSLLAGCASGGNSTDQDNSADNSQQTHGGNNADSAVKHLNIGWHTKIVTLDPAQDSNWNNNRISVGETLTRISDDLQLQPWLAESWEQTDELTWQFTLRSGVSFTNGKALDAEAVKAALARTSELSQRAVTMLNIASMEADGQVLTITTNSVNAALPNNLADFVGVIFDVDTIGEGVIPVGTGPFIIASMEEGQMEMTANRDYWGGVPKLDSVTIRYIEDGNAQAMALDNGEVDMTFQLPTENVAQFEGNDRFTISKRTGSRSQIVYFDLTNPLLADLNVRKAITMAVSRDTLANVVNKGNSEAATAIFPVSFSYGQVPGIGYDVEGAKKLLSDAGYTDSDGDGILEKNGMPLSFTFYTYGSHGSLLPTFAEAMQASLKEVGIALDIQLNDYAAHTDILKAGGFDMALNSYIMAPAADPQYFADIMFRTGADYNYGKYSSSALDALVAELDGEFDTARREELAKEMQEIIAENCPWLTLGHLKFQVVASKSVTGYETQPTELYLLTKDTDINR